MFGAGMLDKLNAMKNLADESKKRLDAISVEGEAGGGLVRIELTGNRNLKSVTINADHTQMSSAKNMFPGL
jgi:DNA-binding protein YbaB